MCGITDHENLQRVAGLGVDYLGFVVDVPDSRRNVSIREAAELVGMVPPNVETVAVTVYGGHEQLREIFEAVSPDLMQVHGLDSDPPAGLEERIIAAVGHETDHGQARDLASNCHAVLVDTSVEGRYGGTGRTHPWAASRRIRDEIYPAPLFLAGGLSPGNVAEAIREVEPFCVDVSTGVEAHPGVKDPEKVRLFVEKAREAEAR